jgi:uncharacterized ion transporter superfamily protein YfcC
MATAGTAKNHRANPPGTPGDDDSIGALTVKFPTAYTNPFGLIAFVAALTWFSPAGFYDRVQSESIGRDVLVLALPGFETAAAVRPTATVHHVDAEAKKRK